MRHSPVSCERACYSIAELQQLLGVGRTAVYKALTDGTIPNIRIGRKFVVPRAAVARMLESVAWNPPAGSVAVGTNQLAYLSGRPRELT
jgi:excisionase family DNA binding protein